MKVAFLLPSFANSGPVNMVYELALSLKSMNIDCSFLSIREGSRKSEFSQLGNVYVIGFNLRSLRSVIVAEKATVLHTHCFFPDLFGLLSQYRSIQITTIHNCFDADYIPLYGRCKGYLLSMIHKLVVKSIRKRVSCSNSVASEIHSLYGIESHSIPNGVSKFNLTLDHDKLSGDRAHIDFYYLGVLNQRKNVKTVIDGYLKADIAESHLHVIGDGIDYKLLTSKYAHNSNITFYGSIQNPRNLIKNFDVFLSASSSEGLPMALLESLSVGSTYLVSDIPSHREVYESAPGAGIICDASVDGIARACRTFMDESALYSFKQKSLSAFEEHFTSDIMAREYSLYYGVV